MAGLIGSKWQQAVPPVMVEPRSDSIFMIPASNLELKDAIEGAAALRNEQECNAAWSRAPTQETGRRERRGSSVAFDFNVNGKDHPAHLETSLKGKSSMSVYGNMPPPAIKELRKSNLMVSQLDVASEGDAVMPGKQNKWWWIFKPKVISPKSKWYRIFWYFTMMVAFLNAILSPYQLAFVEAGGFAPYTDFWAVFEYICTLIFLLDIVLKFFRAYIDSESNEPVTSISKISYRYFKFLFWFDILFMIPFTDIIESADTGMGELAAIYVGLLGFLKVGRLYRIFELFQQLDHNMVISQISLMLLRNMFYILLTCHWFACVFYFIARVEDYHYGYGTGVSLDGYLNYLNNLTADAGGITPPPPSWVVRHLERFDGQPIGNFYIYSLYVSVVSFAGLGDGDFYCATPAESIAMACYLLFNVVLGAYILGTVTMLMVKTDERSKTFRDQKIGLKNYSKIHGLPEALNYAMNQHLELHFQSESMSDERVLVNYPAAIRRRVLRHLYLQPLKQCYLFRKCKAKFLDAVLVAARTDLFMPNIQLISEGDIVLDLNIMIEGEVQVLPADVDNTPESVGPAGAIRRRSLRNSELATGGAGRRRSRTSLHMNSQDMDAPLQGGANSRRRVSQTSLRTGTSQDMEGPGRSKSLNQSSLNMSMGSAQSMAFLDHTRPVSGEHGKDDIRGTSDCFGEVAFFSDVPSAESVWTDTVVRVLILSKAAYDQLLASHPAQVRLVLGNLKEHVDKALMDELQACVDSIPESGSKLSSNLEPYLTDGLLMTSNLPCEVMSELRGALSGEECKRLDRAVSTQSAVASFCMKQQLINYFHLVTAAGKGDEEAVKGFLSQGISPNECDYDKRTCLHIAAQEGHTDVVRMLIEAGADVNAVDEFGTNVLFGAVKHGHDETAKVLVAKGASLAGSKIVGVEVVKSIVGGDLAILARFLRSSFDANQRLFSDTKTALHVAASEGSVAAAKLLIEAGANVLLTDRWGHTALDDAKAARAQPVVELLQPLMKEAETDLKRGSRMSDRSISSSLLSLGASKKKRINGVGLSGPEKALRAQRSKDASLTGSEAAFKPHSKAGVAESPVSGTQVNMLRKSSVSLTAEALGIEQAPKENSSTPVLIAPSLNSSYSSAQSPLISPAYSSQPYLQRPMASGELETKEEEEAPLIDLESVFAFEAALKQAYQRQTSVQGNTAASKAGSLAQGVEVSLGERALKKATPSDPVARPAAAAAAAPDVGPAEATLLEEDMEEAVAALAAAASLYSAASSKRAPGVAAATVGGSSLRSRRSSTTDQHRPLTCPPASIPPDPRSAANQAAAGDNHGNPDLNPNASPFLAHSMMDPKRSSGASSPLTAFMDSLSTVVSSNNKCSPHPLAEAMQPTSANGRATQPSPLGFNSDFASFKRQQEAASTNLTGSRGNQKEAVVWRDSPLFGASPEPPPLE
ncbi:hypothetical protein CEUSTIGMA_g11874.t1 [Chlamydomonas eustigma]|uniref:Cyclic nucleotide-binding domain-containing protein n=1 Tax=Chlamydomonas eustigma TaxID=1157962 RepID=A0A250XMY3_9CHLO|nr:hypothetical protein CEUSTIGMA_g11874.t1 [Chlamydomonas eustigma]|eukprot:GAX84454.1 hypothetical protein CEUSTIGMA_g11874.t1 [Chlamydomonas eustigma]